MDNVIALATAMCAILSTINLFILSGIVKRIERVEDYLIWDQKTERRG